VARILVVCHAYDAFRERRWLLQSMLPYWLAQGHTIRICEGPPQRAVEADLALLHVDCSVLPPSYAEAVQRFPVVVNTSIRDIRKSFWSTQRIGRDADWPGAVIVKSDLNAGGWPEMQHNLRARQLGHAEPHPHLRPVDTYPVYARRSDVPETVWTNPGCTVEKFRPERDERGYWTRFWLFFGDRGRCRRFCSPNPVVKANNAIAVETVDVPPEVVAVRERLGLDYGKIDFVIHQGEPIVVDVNRTPGPTPLRSGTEIGTPELLAPGLDDLLRRRR